MESLPPDFHAEVLWGLNQQHRRLVERLKMPPVASPTPAWWQSSELLALHPKPVVEQLQPLDQPVQGIATTLGVEPEWVAARMKREEAVRVLVAATSPVAPRWAAFPPTDSWNYGLTRQSVLAAADPTGGQWKYLEHRLGQAPALPTSYGPSSQSSNASVGGMLNNALGPAVFDPVTFINHHRWHHSENTAQLRIRRVTGWANSWITTLPFAAPYIRMRLSIATTMIWDAFAGRPGTPS